MNLRISYVAILLAAVGFCYAAQSATRHTFQEVMDVIVEKQQKLSQHDFFKYLSDESIPASKRIRFVPYWSYFALAAADVLDCWIRIPNPQSELERRVNAFIDEDNFHYNLFLYDVEDVLGYTPSRFGSYGAIMRHLWGDDSKALRMLIYAWGSGAKKSKDPIVALASFEAGEAGLKDIFEIAYSKLFKGDGGYPTLKYFGQTHVDLESNHTITAWFKDEPEPVESTLPLTSYEITEETKQLSLEVVEDMFCW